MSLPSRILNALLAISAYARPPSSASQSVDSPMVESVREALGGNLQSQPLTQVRWYMSDLESARYAADLGDIGLAARLCAAMRGDGTVSGSLSSLAGGLTRLPKQFRGHPDIVADLERGHSSVRSVFDEMVPPKELEAIAGDFALLNVAVGELLPVEGRDYPVLCRLDPQFLRYRWNEACWYFNSVAGPIPVVPGDGRWVLFVGTRLSPWQFGKWVSSGKSAILKWQSEMTRANWEAKLANPARVGELPSGATDNDANAFIQRVAQWGINTVFALRPGWKLSLLESKGTGHESYGKSIEDYKNEIIVDLLGQTMTTTGGEGFANSATGLEVRADILQGLADGIGYTINTQVLPQYVVRRYGLDALETPAVMSWTTATAKDQNARAASLTQAAGAVKALYEALRPYGLSPDVSEICAEFAVPINRDVDGDGKPDEKGADETRLGIDLTAIAQMLDIAQRAGLQANPESLRKAIESVGVQLEPAPAKAPQVLLPPNEGAKVLTVDEARAAQGCDPLDDEKGAMLLAELDKAQPAEGDDGTDPEGDDGGNDGGAETETDDETDASETPESGDATALVRSPEPDVVIVDAHAAGWEESKHPRKGGKFAPKGSGGDDAKKKDAKKDTAKKLAKKTSAKRPAPKRKTAKRPAKKRPAQKRKTKTDAEKKREAAKKAKAKEAAKKAKERERAKKAKLREAAKKAKAKESERKKREKARKAKAAAKKKTAKPAPKPEAPKPEPKPADKKDAPGAPEKPKPKWSSNYDDIADAPEEKLGTKPEHEPKHWEEQYKHLGYAAKQAAWGHAAHMRGLDMHPRDVIASVAHLAKGEHASPELTHSIELLRQASESSPDANIGALKGKYAVRFKALGTLAAHAQTMRTRGRMKVGVSVSKDITPEALTEVKRASAFYATFAHKDYTFGDVHAATVEGVERASYTQKGTSKVRANGVVCGRGRRGTLEHELAHCLEAQNPSAGDSARAFLAARTKGDETRKLSEVTKNPAYADDEVTKLDKFSSPYMGKQYPNGATEILSMAAERLAVKPHALLKKDPEMFYFALGMLGNHR